jgi:hypothetical protein
MAVIHFDCGDALIDDADLPLIAGLKLRPRLLRDADLRYVEFKVRGSTRLLHRHLLGAKKGEVVDHINGDGFDNRRENLRICTHAENMQNRRMHRNNKVGFKGVWFDAGRGTYRARVTAFKRRYSTGRFSTAEAAHEAYLRLAQEVHADFHRHTGASV